MKRLFILLLFWCIGFSLFSQTILTQDFESGMNGWQAVSMNTANDYYFGFNHPQTSAYGGSAFFQFSSYYSASDYNQYLISPRLNLTSEAMMSYYCKKISSNGTESFQIMISTTDSAVASFTALGSVINPTSTWTKYTVTLPANTRYVAFHYTSNYQYYMGIDDIVIAMLSSTPEISLTDLQIPSFVNEGEIFSVSGAVFNSSSVTLNSFDVTYTIDGMPTTASITGISVPSAAIYMFTHPVGASISTAGNHPIVVAVSNPNGTSDVVSDNSISDTIKVCGIISSLPYNEGFENGLNCWQAISMNSSNNCGVLSSTSAHSGSSYFRFSSWSSTSSNYAQYLISPELSLGAPTGFSFYAKDMSGYDDESVQVMYSTTNDSISSFTNLGEEIYPDSWHQYVRLLPANTKYVAIKYTAQNQYYTGIDDISFYEVSAAPEIELTEIHAPLMAGNNTPFTITGKIVNHSSTFVSSFTVASMVGGNTTTDTITGVNVAYNEAFEFAIPTPVVISSVGNYSINITVGNPNGVADNLADNTQSVIVEIFESTTAVQRKVLMEHFSTASCPNCIAGHHYIENAMPGYENDIIWVTHHTGYYSDRLTITPSTSFEAFFNDNGSTYAPAVMLDRTYFGDQEFTHAIGTPPGPVFYPYTDLNDGFAAALSIPAYITVEFSAMSYDEVTRQLTVTVSGEVVHSLGAIDPRLNVWLLEDGIIADGDTIPGHGPTQAYAPAGFTHDHVIRELLNTNTWGEDNVIPSTAGATYSKSYTFTISDKYIDSLCYLVAFVSEGDHSNINNCRVYNAEKSRRLTASDPQPHHEGCSFALTYNNQPLRSGDTIQATTINNVVSDVFVGYANVGDADVNFKVQRENIEMAPGAEALFCIAGVCYSGVLSMEIPLPAGAVVPASEVNNALHATYMAVDGGNSLVKYTFFNTEDAQDAVYFYIQYSTETGFHHHTDKNIILYPNPTTDILYVEGLTKECRYCVYSQTGQIVGEGIVVSRIDVSKLFTGVYVLEMQVGKEIVHRKFIVK
ncbi:MAG: choice-of-anchor J domain-containing protein [Bacteroidales bacterium]|nr:choice-of-anchor J domain-containing protein [Bacteroidales bacterium]